MKDFFLYLLAFTNVVSFMHLGFYIIGANIYDARAMWRKMQAKKTVVKPSRRTPLVSVVVPAHNEEVAIARTLDSVRASTYKHIEIIVVENGSTDNTLKVVRSYIYNLPRAKVESYMARYGRSAKLFRRYVRVKVSRMRILLVSQAEPGKASAMNNAILNHVRGKYVMCIDADSVLHPQAIERAVAYFNDPKVIGVAANVRVMDNRTFLGTLQRLEHMIGYRSKKFYTLTNSEFIVGGVASTYRTKMIKRIGGYDTDTLTEDIGLSLKLVTAVGNKKHHIIYASDVVAMTEGVQTYGALMRQRYRWKMGCLQNLLKYRSLVANTDRKYGRMLTWYRMPMAFVSEALLLLEPLVLAYIAYLSIAYRTPWIFIGAYMTITLYTLWTVWPDEHLTLPQKLRLSLRSLQIYVLFYAMDVVQMTAAARCLWNYKKVVNRTTSQTWVSPARAGGPAKASA